MSKHTPGPWQARRVDNQEWRIDAPHGDRSLRYSTWSCLASIYGSDDVPREGRMVVEANASLIAAAPDMLDFAKWVLSLKTGGLIEGRAREVIAKAEGNDATTE